MVEIGALAIIGIALWCLIAWPISGSIYRLLFGDPPRTLPPPPRNPPPRNPPPPAPRRGPYVAASEDDRSRAYVLVDRLLTLCGTGRITDSEIVVIEREVERLCLSLRSKNRRAPD